MKLKNIRLYADMTAEEQMQWVRKFSEWMPTGRKLAEKKDEWNIEDIDDVKRGIKLLASWPFCTEFCEKAARYGDYTGRAYRFNIYIDKILENISTGILAQTADGKKVVQVQPSTPLRRRGRPTKEEAAAKKRGETLVVQGADNTEAKKRKAVAAMLGVDVVVTGEPPREKNNDELRAERKAREKREKAMNPDLFENNEPNMDNLEIGAMGNLSETLPSLQQIKWLLTAETAADVDRVAELRNLRGAESERAKVMAEMGAKEKDIEAHTQAAAEYTEQLKGIFERIDAELAEVNYRLKEDKRYVEKLHARFREVNITLLIKTTNPYMRKMLKQQPTFMMAMRDKVDSEQPERIAEREESEKRKKELSDLIKYIKRTDKAPSDERVKTMTERIERVRELAGDELADALLPILEKTKEDNVKLNEEKAARKAAKAEERKAARRKGAKKQAEKGGKK